MAERPLRAIARDMGTDKEGSHAYADAYERHFGARRHQPVNLLEIGVGGYADPSAGGESLRMWKEFFPLGRIVGVDLHDKSGLAEDRITIVQADQGDPSAIAAVGATYGPFDIIVDDGSHINEHVTSSFRALFPFLAPDGIYAIEDLQTSYWRGRYGGSSGPDRRGTSMTLLQGLVDGLNYAELDVPGYTPTQFDTGITSLTFYHNLAFIQKGANLEGSNFLPPHPRSREFFLAPGAARPSRPPAGPVRRTLRRVIPIGARTALVTGARRISRAVRRLLDRTPGRP